MSSARKPRATSLEDCGNCAGGIHQLCHAPCGCGCALSQKRTDEWRAKYAHLFPLEDEGQPFLSVRPPVQAFVQDMERQLRRNDRKSGWDGYHMTWHLERLLQETVELRGAIARPTPRHREIVAEAADVANFAMMIADRARSEASS